MLFTFPMLYCISIKECETKLNRGRKKNQGSCHQTRCFLEEWGRSSGPWSGGVLSATPEHCPGLALLTLSLHPNQSFVPSLSSASVPILSIPHILPAHTRTPVSPPSPAVAGYPALGSNACPRRAGREPWPFPGQLLSWQETGHRVWWTGRQRGHGARKLSAGVLSEC